MWIYIFIKNVSTTWKGKLQDLCWTTFTSLEVHVLCQYANVLFINKHNNIMLYISYIQNNGFSVSFANQRRKLLNSRLREDLQNCSLDFQTVIKVYTIRRPNVWCVFPKCTRLVYIFAEIPHRLPANTLSPRNTYSDSIGTVIAPVVGR